MLDVDTNNELDAHLMMIMTSFLDDFNDEFYQKYNNDQYKFCEFTGKMSFPTKTQIKKHRKEFELKYNNYFSVYICPHCNQWHLTTVDKYERKRYN